MKLFAYKLLRVQQNKDKDKVKKISFAQYCRNELENNSKVMKRVVSSGECKVFLSGQVNKQNCQIEGSERV